MNSSAQARLLVVDDEAPHLKALCDTLTSQGYTVTGFTSAREALAALHGRSFDLVLTDLMMPEMDGITLLQRAQVKDSNLVGIIMKGEGTIATAVEAMKSGALDYILKPFRVSAVLPVLSRALSIRRLRMENAHLERSVREHAAELEAANRELDAFTHSVSHDLRSPLNSLTGLISLIDNEKNLDEIKVYTALMLESVNKQGKFINDILQSVKNKQAGVEPACDLDQVIEDVVAQNNYSNNGRKLRYYRDVVVKNVNCDALKLKIVLNNLVSNAIKYSDLDKNESWIRIKAYRTESDCVIEVEDNGIGIKGDDKEHIFEKFFAAHQSQESTGIGLYLTKDAVQQMHGTINVNSEYGIGTKFTINIPCFTGNN